MEQAWLRPNFRLKVSSFFREKLGLKASLVVFFKRDYSGLLCRNPQSSGSTMAQNNWLTLPPVWRYKILVDWPSDFLQAAAVSSTLFGLVFSPLSMGLVQSGLKYSKNMIRAQALNTIRG